MKICGFKKTIFLPSHLNFIKYMFFSIMRLIDNDVDVAFDYMYNAEFMEVDNVDDDDDNNYDEDDDEVDDDDDNDNYMDDRL